MEDKISLILGKDLPMETSKKAEHVSVVLIGNKVNFCSHKLKSGKCPTLVGDECLSRQLLMPGSLEHYS